MSRQLKLPDCGFCHYPLTGSEFRPGKVMECPHCHAWIVASKAIDISSLARLLSAYAKKTGSNLLFMRRRGKRPAKTIRIRVQTSPSPASVICTTAWYEDEMLDVVRAARVLRVREPQIKREIGRKRYQGAVVGENKSVLIPRIEIHRHFFRRTIGSAQLPEILSEPKCGFCAAPIAEDSLPNRIMPCMVCGSYLMPVGGIPAGKILPRFMEDISLILALRNQETSAKELTYVVETYLTHPHTLVVTAYNLKEELDTGKVARILKIQTPQVQKEVTAHAFPGARKVDKVHWGIPRSAILQSLYRLNRRSTDR